MGPKPNRTFPAGSPSSVLSRSAAQRPCFKRRRGDWTQAPHYMLLSPVSVAALMSWAKAALIPVAERGILKVPGQYSDPTSGSSSTNVKHPCCLSHLKEITLPLFLCEWSTSWWRQQSWSRSDRASSLTGPAGGKLAVFKSRCAWSEVTRDSLTL